MLPKQTTTNKDLEILQSKWKEQLDPLLKNFPVLEQIVTGNTDGIATAGSSITTINNNIAGVSGLRIIRGRVGPTGTILGGTGFTVTHGGTGLYTIHFTVPFSDVPSCFGCTGDNASNVVSWGSALVSSVLFYVSQGASGWIAADANLHFQCIGAI